MKIAIIGCGAIAAAHLAAIKKMRSAANIYLMDVHRKYAESLSSQFAVTGIYDDLVRLFAEVQPDTAHILTPPRTHFTLARRALDADCHVLIEKPATETLEEFNCLSELADSKSKVLAVDYSILGMPVVQKALGEIRSGRFGRLLAAHCHFAGSWPGNKIPYNDPQHWAYTLKGGVLQNMADHPASLILEAMDPIHEHKVFFASRNVLPHDSPDLLEVMVRNEDQFGSFTLSLGHGSVDRRAYFLLEAGTVVIDLSRQLYSSAVGKGPQNFIKKTLSGFWEGRALMVGTIKNIFHVMTGKLGRDPGIVRVVDNFYRTIRREEKPLVSTEYTVSIIRLLESVWNDLADRRTAPSLAVVDDHRRFSSEDKIMR